MSLMTKSAFATLMEQLADLFAEVRSANTDMNAALVALGYSFYTAVSDDNDPDVEIPMISPAYTVDQMIAAGFSATTTLQAMTGIRALLLGFDAHLARIPVGTLADKTLEGFLIQQAVTEEETLTWVDDIWYTIRGAHVQARAVPCHVAKTMWTHSYADSNETWAGTDGDKLFATTSYLPRGNAMGDTVFENFAAVPITLTKTGVDTLTVTVTVTGINELGYLTVVEFGAVELVGTTPLALDTDYLFADITAVTITGTLTADATFTFKNVVPA